MSLLGTVAAVWRKEMLDTARDRRALLGTLLFGPLFGPLLFAVLINFSVNQQLESVEEDIEVAIIGAEHAHNLVAFLASRGVNGIDDHGLADFDAATAAVRGGQQDVVVLIESSFGDELREEAGAHVGLVFDQSNNTAGAKVNRTRSTLEAYSRQIGTLRLVARGVTPNIMNPLIVDNFDVSTASGRSALLLGISTYFLLMAPLMGGLYLAIDSTAGERERKSLEPLLTTPTTRAGLLIGKLSATVSYMAVSLALTLVSFSIAISFLPLERLGMSSAFSPMTAFMAFLVLLPFVPLGAALMTMVASFSKTHKEAQSFLSFLILIPTLPLIFASIMNVRPSLPLMLVPSLSQHLLVSNLIRGETIDTTQFLVSVSWTFVLGAIVTLVAIKAFKREGFLA
ncbi:MAG: ABC transporter permease [Gammaproteobacteria bacterium]|jgi:sodium transport system permease protein